MKKRKFYISAVYTSPPNTMGGNTKIMVEMINNLIDKFNFIIFTTEPESFKKNIKKIERINLVTIPYPYPKFSFLTHFFEIHYVFNFLKQYFQKNKINGYDYFYSCSDFAPDVMPIFFLKRFLKFKWIASLFLFIPNPIDNFKYGYSFPFIKYIIYFIYQRLLFSFMLKSADYFFITNKFDIIRFPKKFANFILPIYGGVNIDEIPKVIFKNNLKYDAIFCSRLHPQKGVRKLLMIWKNVINELPDARLAIIGNGEKKYESYLKNLANKWLLNENIDWLGYVNGREKFNLYSRSKIFIHSTIYDNNGMVAAEALCTGLPVIMFDLPALKDVYKTNCIKIKPYDIQDFANTIIKLLKNNTALNKIRPDRKSISNMLRTWNWKNKSKIIFNFLK